MTTWIVTAGAYGRDYSKYFIRSGMAFVDDSQQEEVFKQVKKGDILLLKQGLSSFVAAGRVVERNGVVSGNGDKDWLSDFDGWCLNAYCNVEWHVPSEPINATGLKMGTIYQANQSSHLTVAEQIVSTPLAEFVGEPPPTERIEDEKILDFLIKQGLRVSAADELTNALRRIRLLAQYYYQSGRWEAVREHETRTFLVIPLLLALGWAEQQIKIELPVGKGRGRVDIACFSSPYHADPHEVEVLIETKSFPSGLDYAKSQAQNYAKHFESCGVVIVTNGYCYKTYLRDDKAEFSTTPSAYLNIVEPRNRYPLDPEAVGGALDVLKWLLPSTFHRANCSNSEPQNFKKSGAVTVFIPEQ